MAEFLEGVLREVAFLGGETLAGRGFAGALGLVGLVATFRDGALAAFLAAGAAETDFLAGAVFRVGLEATGFLDAEEVVATAGLVFFVFLSALSIGCSSLPKGALKVGSILHKAAPLCKKK